MLPEAQAPAGIAISLRGAANLGSVENQHSTSKDLAPDLKIISLDLIFFPPQRRGLPSPASSWRLLCSLKMDTVEVPRPCQVHCDGCSQITPGYDIVHYGSMDQGYRQLCSRCFNTEVAPLAGLEGFQDAKLEAVGLADCAGELHEFHFRTHLFGTGVALDAFELRDGNPAGYQFQIIGDPQGDLLVLLGRLIEKIRRALSSKHLTDNEHGPQIADQVVHGRIEWHDDCGGRVPLLVIDGREIAWDEFGRMLMSFEGSQFKLNIADKSAEL